MVGCETLRGLLAYVTVMEQYYSVFKGDPLTRAQVVERLAFVVTFFRVWVRWLTGHKDYSCSDNGPTAALAHDIETSAAFIVTVMAYAHDTECLQVVRSLCGTDVVEMLWSMIGGYGCGDCRVYTAAYALNKVSPEPCLCSSAVKCNHEHSHHTVISKF